ncbi:MAG: ATP-dependent DNA helicase RecG [Gemmatimonadaceae bacterium]|nr:ATP-dependent DNA helicase RecG [Chitinophagaceae bacterium]
MSQTASILANPIEYLKGVGPLKGDMLKKELEIFNFQDLLEHFPLRHIDRTRLTPIGSITPAIDFLQAAGRLVSLEVMGEKAGKRLVGQLRDNTGTLELVWFQGISWVQKNLVLGSVYLVYGRLGFFLGLPQINHPEIEAFTPDKAEGKNFLEPVYPATEKLKTRGLGGRQIGKLTQQLIAMIKERDLPENLPGKLVSQFGFPSRYEAIRNMHFPADADTFEKATNRIKFEELFIAQIRMGLIKSQRHRYSQGNIFSQVGDLFNRFYKDHLPFELTGAQKRVLREIRNDTGHGRQMNRLLQGDVGSGKTIVALLCMLLAADNGFQSVLMAPTEILANQHYTGLKKLLEGMPVRIEILTGSTKKSARNILFPALENGEVHFLISTHAVLEDPVKFKNLGLAVVDEQHRFGVAQRARLWKKAAIPPHVLVMTATPIPRTLAMTAYGDLDYSVIDELPPGRKPIKTVHRFEHARAKVMDFIKEEITKGRQAYIIFPLIEESEKLDYENLMRGYENVKAFFPEPKYWISMVHGRQTALVKETNMQRFVKGDTQIMVSTTVIEVGVNVPNASVMVIESSEKFGLSQLHQLRGRVGRGADQSFCILLTGVKPTINSKERIKIMCSTNDGFKIAEKDLELRGPGDISGTRQSGELNFKLANLLADKQIMQAARETAQSILDADPDLNSPDNLQLKTFLQSQKGKTGWSRIS